jgi:hypothetical protein
MSDNVFAVPSVAISELKLISAGLEHAYISMAGVQPSSVFKESDSVIEQDEQMQLVDLFEYMHLCYSHDKKQQINNEDDSTLWCLLKYLGLLDLLNLR